MFMMLQIIVIRAFKVNALTQHPLNAVNFLNVQLTLSIKKKEMRIVWFTAVDAPAVLIQRVTEE